MTPDERKRRGQEAQRLLDNALFQEAWDQGHGHYLRAMEDERDPAKRDKLWQALQVFKVVKSHFEALVRDGEAAGKIHAAHDRKLKAAGRERFSLHRPPMDILRSIGGMNGTR